MKNSSQEVSKIVKKKEEEEGSDGDAAKTHCILWGKGRKKNF